MRKIPIKNFIILQVLIMLIIAMSYLLIYPKIKPMCFSPGPCAQTTHCECLNDICNCEYLDENENIQKIKCPIEK